MSRGGTRSPLARFRSTFRDAHARARLLVAAAVSPRDGRLLEMMRFTLANQTTSDYPFVFKYAFCRRERDAARSGWLAGAIHLLQSSGFVTDDIFDGSPLRYGAAAVHVRYGVDDAVIASQLMQSIALEAASRELERGRFPNACQALRVLNQIVRELYVGQYLDIHNSADPSVSVKAYDRVIALGVGRYYGHVARCGALLAGRGSREVQALTRFGYHYGMAVFITDDILDIAVKPRRAGLVAGSDLVMRRMRLPLILALRQAGREDAAALRRFLNRSGPTGKREYDRVARIITGSGALESCRRRAARHVAAARRALAGLEDRFSAGMLGWLAATLMAAQGLED